MEIKADKDYFFGDRFLVSTFPAFRVGFHFCTHCFSVDLAWVGFACIFRFRK